MTFLVSHDCWTTSTKFPWKKICQEIFRPSFYCLKCFAELNINIFKQWNPFLWMVNIVEQLRKNFHGKKFVRKYFVPLLFVWNIFPSSKMKFFGHKIYFAGWSRLLKIFIETATLESRPHFLSRWEFIRNQFLQLASKNLPIFVLNLFGQDCWRKTIWEIGLKD